MKVEVDRNLCVGHAHCVQSCPKVFKSDELGYAVVLNNGEVPADEQDNAIEAVNACPEQAINIS